MDDMLNSRACQQLANAIGRHDCFLQALIDAIPTPVFYKDAGLRYQGGNQAWCSQIMGLPLREIRNRTVFELPVSIPRDLAEKYQEKDLALLESGQRQHYECPVRCADGRVREFLFQKAVLRDAGGQASGIVGVMMDVTEANASKMALEATQFELHESHQRLEDILFSLPHGVVVIDAATHSIIDMNPQASSIIGAPTESIVGRECHQVICPNEKGNCPITDQGKQLNSKECTVLAADGSAIPVFKTVIPTNIGGRECLIESFVDITDHKQVAEAKAQKEKLLGIIEVAGAVCHELNQPLMIASGMAELLQMQSGIDDAVAGRLGAIKEQIDRMGRITRKLMNITRYRTKDYLKGKILDLELSSEALPPEEKAAP